MPDITKCDNEKCPLKEKCYRWTSKWDEYQAYSHFEPDKKGKCEYQLIIGKDK
jgi:hypothetical protein